MSSSGLVLASCGAAVGLLVRLLLAVSGAPRLLETRIEVATPLNSWSRLQEGHWLWRHGISPYSTSVFHSSPLLLYFLGPLSRSTFSILMVVADVASALVLYFVAQRVIARSQQGRQNESRKGSLSPSAIPDSAVATTAFLVFLLSPLRIACAVGPTTSPVGDLFFLCSLLTASLGQLPLSAFCWLMATHLWTSYAVMAVPLGLLLAQAKSKETTPNDTGYGAADRGSAPAEQLTHPASASNLTVTAMHFSIWATISFVFLLGLTSLILDTSLASASRILGDNLSFEHNTRDLAPNVGLRWYFFSEVFPEVRDFFSFVFAGCVLLVVTPLTLRLWNSPLFLSFLLLLFCNLLAPYPSASNHGLAISFSPIFLRELSAMRGSFVVLLGFFYAFTMGPIMFDLWCLKGIGNANFYYAVNLVFGAAQGLFLVQSTWADLSDKALQGGS